MKHKSSIFSILSLLMVASMLLAACAPAATPTAAPAPTQPPAAQPTTPPAAQPTTPPVAAPTTAPTTPPAAAGPTKGGSLVIAELGGYYTLDPFATPWHAAPQYATYDTLLTLKPDLTGYVGDLVEDKWEPAADNLSVTFHVRPGLKFQDGTPVNAAALKWNLDHWTDQTVAAPGGGNLQGVYKSSEAPDDSTLIVNLTSPYAPLYNELANLEIVSPTAYQAAGPDKFAQAPVGAGPWKVKDIVADNSVTYVRNEDYTWFNPLIFENKGPVYPDQLTFKYMGDEQVEYAALETGEIALLPAIPSQFIEQAKANPNLAIVQGQEAGGTYLGFNTQFKPFDNPKVRVAISYAINRDEIIQAALNGAGVPMYTPLANSEIGFSQQVEDYAKTVSDNVDTAKQMLDDLGYKVGSDGIRVGPDGKKMEYILTTTPDDARKRGAETIQAQLADIGVKVNIDIKETQVVMQMTVEGTHQMILWGFGLIDPNILTYLFSSERIGKSNRTRYSNPELDKMLVAADSEMNYDARMQKVADILKLLVDNRPNVPIWSQITYLGYRKDIVGGLKFDKLGGYLLGDAYLLKP
ncbi:MAG: ABC transporter substrate-binding protein [Chloroflexi bacterium]|nr:ABC transporter substrate-binding protein [Chloroflexota bacterium]